MFCGRFINWKHEMGGMMREIGREAAFVVDGRYAETMAVGDNGAFAATWLLIDTFPTGTAMAE